MSLADFTLFFELLLLRWSWKGTQWKGRWSDPWQGEEPDELSEDDEEPPPKLILKERNPWLTPTESCASDETEEEEKLIRAPFGLSDPVGKDVKSSDSRHELHGCQSGATANAGNHLQPRYKTMKDMRPFDGIITEQASGRQMDQTRLSFLGWNEGLKRGKLTNIAVGFLSRDPTPRIRLTH